MIPSLKITLTVVVATLSLPGHVSAVQAFSEREVVELRQKATAHAYLGASLLLKCLSDAKSNGKSDLEPAKEQLVLSKQTYEVLANSDRARANIPEIKDEKRSEILTKIAAQLEMSKIKVEFTEEGIARANIQAINQIRDQISKLKDCTTLAGRPDQLILLLENKINLERTTQLAEGAWDGPY